MHTDKHNDAQMGNNEINRRDVLIAGAGLTAATVAGARAIADSNAKERHEPFAGFEIPLPKSWIGDHYNDNLHHPIKEISAPLTANVNEKNPLEFDLLRALEDDCEQIFSEHTSRGPEAPLKWNRLIPLALGGTFGMLAYASVH